MKKAVVYNIFGIGHISPTLPIVRRLVKEDFEVTYFTSPERRDLVEQSGARFKNYGRDDYKAADYNPGKNFVLQTIPATVGLLPYLQVEFERLDPDLMIYDSMAPWGFLLSKIYQIPSFCSVSTFALSPKERLTTFKNNGVIEDETNVKARQFLLEKFGVEMPLINTLGAYNDCNLVYTSRGLNPSLGDMNQNHFHFVGPLLNSNITSPPAPEKIITMSLGTILPRMEPKVLDWYRALISALGDQTGIKVILAAGTEQHLNALGELPSNCSAHLHIPQQEVLSYTDVFINHGGMNSVNEAIYHGVPQLIIPHSHDQFVNAARVKELHLGHVLNKEEITTELLKKHVFELLNGTFTKERVQIHQKEFRATRGIEDVMNVIQGRL